MKQDYLISVIIPVHNTAQYLRKCVDSIRNQSLQDIEIILVDNLSSDASSEICDEYSKLDSRIKVLHLLVSGLSVARNAGLEIASAPYVGFVDSDDYVDSEMYSVLLSALVQNQARMAYCNLSYELDDSCSDLPSLSDSGEIYVRTAREVLRDMMLEKISSSSCTKLYDKQLFSNLRFPEGFFFEDHSTVHNWMVMCDRIVWVDKSFYHYIQREGSICHSFDAVKHYHFFLANFSRLEFVKKQSLFEGECFEINTKLVQNCYYHFKEVMEMIRPKHFSEPIKDMRIKFKSLLSIDKAELDSKYYKRLRKIVYFWPLYYFVRFYLKRGKW
ncbi:glycosyltransferase family 2 protein [Bacteroides ihuae]|uniref:glycosyltransferase family 2 protein n=1 Tax=Bacteroides ihuae TaxID=1852362 RepID=UPI0008DB2181|nr:glycosyltransferase [Bacteroides ihuae]